ncbi:MAG: aldehyde ferredoxin oxidoreductase family protein [Candidatus Helarchaeota archaeon]|nr:aldehyde ferredoxin oxidoreductase family protein [Candidatus Helarchaeota archaeon]
MSEKLLGYNGKIAFINLKDKKIEIKDLDPQIARDYIGGTGLSVKLIYDLLSNDDYTTLQQDIFSEINPLVFATGPLTATIVPSSGRYSVSGLSPLTHHWGEGTSGGHFCISLRRCGYDAIVLTGKAESPTYLYINDGKIEFKDANKAWGKDSYQTQEIIKQELNTKGIRVACIGIAGENLVKYAAIMNDDGRAVGRCGLGALMGSKKLKALAVQGSNKIELGNQEKLKELRAKIESSTAMDVMRNVNTTVRNLFGTNSYFDMGVAAGDVPGYYFTETEFLAEKLTSKTIKEEYPVFITGCAMCSIRCAKQTVIPDNGEEIQVDGPEYESVAALGSLCGVFDSKPVILAHHKCNVHGIDVISCGVSIAFLIYLIENKIGVSEIKKYLKEITIEDIHWGNGELVLDLIDRIAKREGIGNLLAEGVKVMAEKLKVDSNLAAHVKGLEIPMHEPRAFAGQALSYMTSCTGANHNKGDWFSVQMGVLSFKNLNIVRAPKDEITGREGAIIALQDFRGFEDSAVYCNFATPPNQNQAARYLSYTTGIKYKGADIITCGERMNNLKRLIACNMGITRNDDYLPKHVLEVFETGGAAGIKLELDENLQKYYELRGWDWSSGRPTEEKLKELGII